MNFLIQFYNLFHGYIFMFNVFVMCLCPKVIYNRSNHFLPEAMPLMMQVPCGKCDECNQLNRNSWFVRCWSEYNSPKTKQTFFYTFTYNNEHLPYKYGIPCFDKRDVQLFCKRFKKALAPACNVRYFFSCEFGEKYGRPHMHVLFFLDRVYNPFIFYKLVERHWGLGFVKYGDNAGVVNGLAGIQYVTKYVTKDFMYTDKFNDKFTKMAFRYYEGVFNRFIRLYRIRSELVPYFCNNQLKFKRVWSSYEKETHSYILHSSFYLSEDNKDFVQPFINRFRRVLARHLPYHTQSTYLGANYAQTNFGVENIPVVMPNGYLQRFSLPRYFRRMFWYDRVENENDGKLNRYVLSEEGIKHYIDGLPKDFEKYQSEVRSLILSCDRIKDADVREVNASLSKCEPFEDARCLQFYLRNFDLDLDVLAIYHNVFRGRICTRTWDEVPLNDKIVKESYLDFVKLSFVDTSVYDYGKIYEHDVKQYFKRMLYDCHPFFQPYEMACELFDALKRLDGVQRFRSRRHDEIILRKLKEKYEAPPPY